MALAGWPQKAGLDRSKRIFEEVRGGNFEHQWCPLKLENSEGNTLELLVSCDALKIDGIRVNVDAFTQQELADLLGGVLLTPKIVDEIYRRSPKIPPRTMPITSSTAGMISHSQRVDARASGLSAPPAFANVGKDWVLARAIFTTGAIEKNRAANYGWLGAGNSTSVTGLPLWQSIGTTHPAGMKGSYGHVDYSQVARFAHRDAKFNGSPVDLAKVYTGEEPGTSLISHEGSLPMARLPAPGGKALIPPPKGIPPPPGQRIPPGGTPVPGTTVATTPKKKGSVVLPVGGAAAGAVAGTVIAGPPGAVIGAIIGGVVGAIARRA